MRERATALGGFVEAAPTASGGFRVHAELPLHVQDITRDEGRR
jgi:signal transduction histidine kinase